MAQQGARSPLTVEDITTIGTITWDFPGNAVSNNGLFAEADLSLNGISHYLRATNFGFTIPGGSSIDGILVEILRQEDDSLDNIFDNAVRIVKGGIIGSSDKSSTTEWGINESSYISYGSSTDSWGETWNPSDINASNFGVALSAKAVNGLVFTSAEVDHIRITIYYTQQATTTSTSTSTTSTTTSTSTTSTSTSTSSSTSTSTSTSSSTSTTSTSSSTSLTTSTSTSTSSSTTSTSTSTSTTSTSTSTTSTSTSTTSTSTSTTTTFAFHGNFRVEQGGQR